MDYKALGLRVGLEIHRQIESHKLFCNCKSTLKEDKPDFTVKRYLRASAGEIGEIDIAAKFEELKKKYFVYEGYNENTCLVELDEEPIHEVNKKALEAVLQVALMLNAKIVDKIDVMRKVVIDGSNTSGFQRTALLGRDGFVRTKYGNVKIETIMLEEDAARKISEDKEKIVYRLDRLGIPLIEIATEPMISNPQQVKDVAAYIGMILKSTAKFKGGIGTIRQDLNLSIKQGNRVEIKGVQDLNSIPKVIENEIKRQLNLIYGGKKVGREVRRALSDNSTEFLRPMPGAARMYPETDTKTILVTADMLKNIKLPELLSERAYHYENTYCLNSEIANLLVKRKIDFDEYVSKYKNTEAKLLARVLILMPKDIKKRYNVNVGIKDLDYVLELYDKGKISEGFIEEILIKKGKNEKIDLSRYKVVSDNVLEKEIKEIVDKNKDLSFNALMGIVMGKYKGKVSGEKVAEILRKVI